MRRKYMPWYIGYLLIFSVAANSYMLVRDRFQLLFFIIPAFLIINLFAGVFHLKTAKKRLRVCFHGAVLLCIFEVSALISSIYHIVLAFYTIPGDWVSFVWSGLMCILLEALLFWNGILCVYFTSVQLGIKQRVVGALCGMIPIANLVVLNIIITTVFKEVSFETEKEQINFRRRQEKICGTKYPILMVHGVFFRDTKYFNYWGRIPKELQINGATVYYGNHQSAASICDSAQELTARIKEIVEKTKCEKVNIIAHSKGGLDCRYAIAKLDAVPYIASLTTINTPHRGCLFADHLLTMIPAELKNKVARGYNTALKKLGDTNPDFLAAVNDLTDAYCVQLDKEMEQPDGIFCQSVGSTLHKASSGNFPLNFSYHLVKCFDGPNDGLVSENSFRWGETYSLLTANGKRGISHGDMIDLTRKNIDGFDVREFYVGLVNDLKNRGY